jgi:hypothetical protein
MLQEVCEDLARLARSGSQISFVLLLRLLTSQIYRQIPTITNNFLTKQRKKNSKNFIPQHLENPIICHETSNNFPTAH